MAVATDNTIHFRYPGTKFFESFQQAIFFGRAQETLDLIDSIKAYDVFVIFADSGIGKTSLLNAGLIPALEKENMEVIKFRFQDTAQPPLQIIYEQIKPYTQTSSDQDLKLWRLFKSCQFNGKLPVFVFDQFEEFFNHSKPLREQCINELADLINEYLPDYVRAEMKEKFRDQDPTAEDLKYYTAAHVKLLFLIRADKLKLLDDLSQKIPLILRNRFYLKHLSIKQAEQAIVLPALLPQNGFAAPSFNIQEEAVADICNYLKNEEGEVESFQLQILCQELEKRIISRFENKEHALWISKEELGGDAGMDSITKNYYNNQLKSIKDESMRTNAISLIEDNLIVEDRRISLPENFLIKEGYSKELLDYLLNETRLIRVFNDRDARYYELSHDRLLPSILKSKRQREEEQSKQNQLKELQLVKEEQDEKNKQLQKEKQEQIRSLELKYLKEKVKKAKWLRIFSVVLLALTIGLILVFIDSEKANIRTNIALAKALEANQDYDGALKILQNARSVIGLQFKNDSISKLKTDITRWRKNKITYTENIHKGDNILSLYIPFDTSVLRTENMKENGEKILNALNAKALFDARNYFLNAQKTGFDPIEQGFRVGDRLRIVEQLIGDYFNQCITATKQFLTNKDMALAMEAYRKAQRVYAADSVNLIIYNESDINSLDHLQQKLKQ